MRKIKLSLIMAMAVSSYMMAQQSASIDDKKFEMNPMTSDKIQVSTVDLGKEDKNTSEKVTIVGDIKMYPNPAKDLVTLQGVKVDDHIIIADNKGKNRIQIKAKAEVEIIPIEFLESGIYMVFINGEKRRLIVE